MKKRLKRKNKCGCHPRYGCPKKCPKPKPKPCQRPKCHAKVTHCKTCSIPSRFSMHMDYVNTMPAFITPSIQSSQIFADENNIQLRGLKKCHILNGLELCARYFPGKEDQFDGLSFNVKLPTMEFEKLANKNQFSATMDKINDYNNNDNIDDDTIQDNSDDIVSFGLISGNMGFANWRANELTTSESIAGLFSDYSHYFDEFEYDWNDFMDFQVDTEENDDGTINYIQCSQTLPLMKFRLCGRANSLEELNNRMTLFFKMDDKVDDNDSDDDDNDNDNDENNEYEMKGLIDSEFRNALFDMNANDDWDEILRDNIAGTVQKCSYLSIAKLCMNFDIDNDGNLDATKASVRFQTLRSKSRAT